MKPYLTFSQFQNFPNLICAVSTVDSGDLWVRNGISSQAENFLQLFSHSKDNLIVMKQPHGITVEIVDHSSSRMIDRADALITGHQNLLLGVNIADCVPLFFFDPKKKITAVAHSGWKGTIDNISGAVIDNMQKMGSTIEDIRVVVGPHIGACCYHIPIDRADRFRNVFDDSSVIFSIDDIWYLDLAKANFMQLIKRGILSKNVEVPVFCTHCQANTFFSFRRQGKATGEMLGIIGVRS